MARKPTMKDSAREALAQLGMPERQRNDMCCHVLLALLGLGRGSVWSEAQNGWTRIHDIIAFLRERYNVRYAENSRETIRKEALHRFRTAALVEDNGQATNSPNYRYRVTPEALECLRAFGGRDWPAKLASFRARHASLSELYASRKSVRKIPVVVDGVERMLSTGAHNRLQKSVVEEFAPRFAKGARCLYLGDTAKRDLVNDAARLGRLGFSISMHDAMPDVVLHSERRNWIYFVECVTSVGPVSPQRMIELKKLANGTKAGLVFVTAFPDFRTFKRFADKLAWDTEAWIAEMPDHMIHMNGDRFVGPRA